MAARGGQYGDVHLGRALGWGSCLGIAGALCLGGCGGRLAERHRGRVLVVADHQVCIAHGGLALDEHVGRKSDELCRALYCAGLHTAAASRLVAGAGGETGIGMAGGLAIDQHAAGSAAGIGRHGHAGVSGGGAAGGTRRLADVGGAEYAAGLCVHCGAAIDQDVFAHGSGSLPFALQQQRQSCFPVGTVEHQTVVHLLVEKIEACPGERQGQRQTGAAGIANGQCGTQGLHGR